MNIFSKLAAASAFAAFTLSASSALAVDEHFIKSQAVASGYDVVHTTPLASQPKARLNTLRTIKEQHGTFHRKKI